MAELREYIDKLTRPSSERIHQENAAGIMADSVIIHLPLLEILRTEVRASTGGTRGGANAAHERVSLSLEAFGLYEDIDGRISSMYNSATDLRPLETPELTLEAWYKAFRHEIALRTVTDVQIALQTSRVAEFVTRIEAFFKPATSKEITSPCPICGERYWFDASNGGARSSTLYARFKVGEDIEARCRWCGTEWTGDAQLVALAKMIGQTIDLEALRNARTVHSLGTATEVS